ncbi:MAG: hypothetical protein P8Y04_10700 [Desulfobulbaceae bacterium]
MTKAILNESIVTTMYAGLKKLKVDESSNLPYLLELLSLKEITFEKTGMTPAIRKDRINEALKRICLGGAEVRTLIMAFEDLHWIDKMYTI